MTASLRSIWVTMAMRSGLPRGSGHGHDKFAAPIPDIMIHEEIRDIIKSN